MRDYHSQPANYPEQNCLKSSAAEERDQLDSNPHPPGIANSHPRQPSCISAGQINLHLHLAPETNLITELGETEDIQEYFWCSLFLIRNTNLSYTSSDQRDLKSRRVCR
jgi:hypothetical protein